MKNQKNVRPENNKAFKKKIEDTILALHKSIDAILDEFGYMYDDYSIINDFLYEIYDGVIDDSKLSECIESAAEDVLINRADKKIELDRIIKVHEADAKKINAHLAELRAERDSL